MLHLCVHQCTLTLMLSLQFCTFFIAPIKIFCIVWKFSLANLPWLGKWYYLLCHFLCFVGLLLIVQLEWCCLFWHLESFQTRICDSIICLWQICQTSRVSKLNFQKTPLTKSKTFPVYQIIQFYMPRKTNAYHYM